MGRTSLCFSRSVEAEGIYKESPTVEHRAVGEMGLAQKDLFGFRVLIGLNVLLRGLGWGLGINTRRHRARCAACGRGAELLDRETVDDLTDAGRALRDLLRAALLLLRIDETAELHSPGKCIHIHVFEFVNVFMLEAIFNRRRYLLVILDSACASFIVGCAATRASQDNRHTQTTD